MGEKKELLYPKFIVNDGDFHILIALEPNKSKSSSAASPGLILLRSVVDKTERQCVYLLKN
jgi:hypothetical protein